MAKYWISPYQLKPKTRWSSSETQAQYGFLLRVQTSDYKYGYADVCPRRVLGDESLDQQLQALLNSKPTALLRQSLFFADLDGRAREEKKSIFVNNLKVKSHYTCSHVKELNEELIEKIQQQGFTTIKVKVSDEDYEQDILSQWMETYPTFRWRMDFNSNGFESWILFCKKNSRSIDLIEDPSRYQYTQWLQWQKESQVRFYVDQPKEFDGNGAMFPKVIKPARQNIWPSASDIITNSMDHGLGQSFAFWWAQQSVLRLQGQSLDYGLQTLHLQESDEFTRRLETESCFFKNDDGYGVGFDDLLKSINWKLLS